MFKIIILCLFSFVYSGQQLLSPLKLETTNYGAMKPLSSYQYDSQKSSWKTPFLIGVGVVFVSLLAVASYSSYEASKVEGERDELNDEYMALKLGDDFEAAKEKWRVKNDEFEQSEMTSYGLFGAAALTGIGGGYVVYAF